MFANKELRSLLKISAKMNCFDFLRQTNPSIKEKFHELHYKLLKLSLDYPYKILIDYISLHFEIFETQIEKEKLTEHYEEVI